LNPNSNKIIKGSFDLTRELQKLDKTFYIGGTVYLIFGELKFSIKDILFKSTITVSYLQYYQFFGQNKSKLNEVKARGLKLSLLDQINLKGAWLEPQM